MAGERGAGKGSGGDDDKDGAGITIEVLQQHFHQPLVTVADELGVSLTMIKRLCRKLGMPRWPYRQIDSINKAMEDLHDQLENARTEADRTRFRKLLEAALKKKRLITRGAAAGVDPNVRNALYLADTANVSEEDIFDNPELMPKLSAALKTITKRKRVKGKPLVELIATVQRDGTLPACVQSTGSSSSGGSNPTLNRSASAGTPSSRTPGAPRRHPRPPALVDAMATSNEEYHANLAQAFGNVNRPGSSASAATSVSPALSSLGNGVGNGNSDDHARLGWGHNNDYGSQWGGQRTPASVRGTGVVTGGSIAGAPLSSSHHGRGGNDERLVRDGFGAGDGALDSPASSCTTLVAGTSPAAADRFSPGGSLAGGFSPATKKSLSPVTNELAQRHARMARPRPQPPALLEAGPVPGIVPGGAQSAPAAGTSGHPSVARASHWGQVQPSPRRFKPHKRLSTTSSLASTSTDVESLDTSHLLEFDDDDDDDPTYGPQQYTATGSSAGSGEGFTTTAAPIGQRARAATVDGRTTTGTGAAGVAGGGGAVTGGNEQHETHGVSPEDLQELEDVLLMDSFGVMDELLEGEDIAGPFPDLQNRSSFPDLQTVGASLPPLPRSGHAQTGQRGTPRLSVSAGTSSPQHLLGQPVFGSASPSHATASPVGTSTSGPGFTIPGTSVSTTTNGAPRPGPRALGRPRNQVPPRPYTPGKSSRGGGSTPWLSHALNGGISPRVGSSPRPPTPGTPSGARLNGHPQGRCTQPGPSPKNRRRGEEAFPDLTSSSPIDHGTGARGAPSPKARRVGQRAFPERFPGSPLAGTSAGSTVSPRIGFPPQSPRSSGAVGANGTLGGAPSPLDGNGRSYFSGNTGTNNGSMRGHNSTPGHNWCASSMPSGGEAGADAAVAAGAAKTTGFEVSPVRQNWSVRSGDHKTNMLASVSAGRQNWSLSAGGDMQNFLPSPSPRRASTGVVNAPDGNTSVSGVLGLDTTSAVRFGSNNTSERASPPPWPTPSHGHGVLQRRHSAPIAVATTQIQSTAVTAAAPDVSDDSPGISPLSKTEAMGAVSTSNPNDGFGQTLGATDSVMTTAAGWAPPAPPPSPITEQLSGEVAAPGAPECSSIPARTSALSFDEQESVWWAPLGRISSGGIESLQAPVPASAPAATAAAVAAVTSSELTDAESKLETSASFPLIMGL